MIAFAYIDTTPDNAATYRPLVDGMVKSVRETMPEQEILLLTDESTAIFHHVNAVLRIPKTTGLMTWRLKCHQVAHSVSDEILFIEPDVRLKADVMDVFDKAFDVAVTSREHEVLLDNKKINTPFTLGMTFSRSQDFWREAKLFCQTLDEKDQDWFGDIMAIAHVVQDGKFNVEVLDGAIYNHVVNDPDKPTNAKALHYKGKRKVWLFPLLKEVDSVVA